jgi:cardiolipin synthase
MNKKRLQWWLAALALAGVMASCRTLPDAERLPDTPVKANPTVETARGTLQKGQAAQLLQRRWANATTDLKQLAVLEEPPPSRSTWKPISSTRTRSACSSPNC